MASIAASLSSAAEILSITCRLERSGTLFSVNRSFQRCEGREQASSGTALPPGRPPKAAKRCSLALGPLGRVGAASIKTLKLTRIFLDFIDPSLDLEFGKK